MSKRTYIKTVVNEGLPDCQIYETDYEGTYKNTFYSHFNKLPREWKKLTTSWSSCDNIDGEISSEHYGDLIDHQILVLMEMLEDEWI